LVLDKVGELRKESPRLGTRKLYVLLTDFLCEHQIKMGRDALFDLMADNYLLVRRKRRRMVTTHSGHWLRRYPNLIVNLEVTRVNQLWVSDITYLKTRQGFLYLSLVTDACSHKIMGYDLADNLESVNAIKALKMAINNELKHKGDLRALIHHSDQGFQYCSSQYTDLLKSQGIAISMSDRGQPLQNAIAERINGIIKHEYLLVHTLQDRQKVLELLSMSVKTYNTVRPHMSCNMLTPDQAHGYGLKLQKTWKNYYRKKQPEEVNVCSD
jgi:putative transposase